MSAASGWAAGGSEGTCCARVHGVHSGTMVKPDETAVRDHYPPSIIAPMDNGKPLLSFVGARCVPENG